MSKNSIRFALQKGQLSSNEENSFAKDFLDNIKAENEENSFAKDFLDIDFFNSRKSRILDNIKAENELELEMDNELSRPIEEELHEELGSI